MWVVARIVFAFFPRQDQIGAMVLLLCVLATATQADRWLAVTASLSASLSFSYYFIKPAYSFSITSTEDAIGFGTFIIVALVGSHLSLQARLREEESERRRAEMSRLQELGASLLASETVRDTADKAVREIVRLFGGGAVLRMGGYEAPFQAGNVAVIALANGGVRKTVFPLGTTSRKDSLELCGVTHSAEMQSALVNLIGLVLDKAAAAEERARIESAQRGDELRTTVLNALAHNFRTPLTCIKAAASMMRGSAGESGTYSQELVEVIDEEADHLDELIRDSLGTARIQSRQTNPQVEDCAVDSIISAVTNRMKRHLAQRLVMVEIPEGLPVIRGDRFLFEQMITQVLDNAWKYSGTGAWIRIAAEASENEVRLTIQNQGTRIPDAERALVFDRFYRGPGNRTSIEGTGLGLAITRTIAEALGGKVWLDNEPDGPAFRFALPAGATEEDHDRQPQYTAY